MKRLIPFSVLAFITVPAYADLSWSTNTAWSDNAISSALNTAGASDNIKRNFSARYGAMTNKVVNGAYMGALYAASLDGNVAPIAAVDAGYDFMRKLIKEQSSAQSNATPSVDISDDDESAKSDPDQQSDDVSDDEENEYSFDTSPLTDADIERAKESLAFHLANKCNSLPIVENSTDWVARDSKLNCTRVSENGNAFRCDYSLQYIMGANQNGVPKKSYICRPHNSPFNAIFYKNGIESDAVVGMFEEGDVQDTAGNTNQQPNDNKKIVTDVKQAQEIVGSFGQMKCAGMLGRAGNYKTNESDVKCELRDNNKFVCRCRYAITFEGDRTKTCSTVYTGQVYTGTEYPLGGYFYNTTTYNASTLGTNVSVQPMPTPTLEPEYELQARHQMTRKERNQVAKDVKKELREIEKREKNGVVDTKTTPAYVAPLTDGTTGDLGPDQDPVMQELMNFDNVTVPANTKKEQSKTDKKTKKNQKANKKKTEIAPAAPLPPRASMPEPDYLEAGSDITNIDLL